LLFAYGLGLIMNVTLFVLCFHLYKKNYGIIILNQLLINIVYCTTNLIVYIVVYIFITIDVFITQFYFAPNQPFWAFFLYNICDVGAESLLYVQQMALLLLCANRCLTMLNFLWLKPWMSYKMHIVYSAACWAFLTIEVSTVFIEKFVEKTQHLIYFSNLRQKSAFFLSFILYLSKFAKPTYSY
jgi:hypothetical protein